MDRGRASAFEVEVDDYDPAVNCHCGTCGRQFNGSDSSGGHHRGGEYGGCCQSFASLSGFNKHMRLVNGRTVCLTPDDMRAKGWTVDDNVTWRLPAPKSNPWKKEASA